MLRYVDAALVEHEVRYAFEFLSRTPGWRPLPPQIVKRLTQDLVAFARVTPPLGREEIGIVSLLKPMTAALIADRVWLPYAGHDPKIDFAFCWDSPLAIRLAALFALIKESEEPPPSSVGELEGHLSGDAAKFVLMAEGSLAKEYAVRSSAAVCPLFESAERRDASYQAGNYPVIVTVVENVAVVSEDSLTWDLVREFRRDPEARAAYRRFIHWLDRDMVGKSAQFIADEVSQCVESYNWAIRKHGLQTVIGTIERTLSARSLLGAGAATMALSALGYQQLLTVLAGTGLLVGQAAIHAATALLAREEIVVANRDIAFVHHIKKSLQD